MKKLTITLEAELGEDLLAYLQREVEPGGMIAWFTGTEAGVATHDGVTGEGEKTIRVNIELVNYV